LTNISASCVPFTTSYTQLMRTLRMTLIGLCASSIRSLCPGDRLFKPSRPHSSTLTRLNGRNLLNRSLKPSLPKDSDSHMTRNPSQAWSRRERQCPQILNRMDTEIAPSACTAVALAIQRRSVTRRGTMKKRKGRKRRLLVGK
jgi:hypothetical protein